MPSPKQQVIEFADGEIDVKITLRSATVRDGLRRVAYRQEGEDLLKVEKAKEVTTTLESRLLLSETWLSLIVWPCCMACVAGIDNKPDSTRKILVPMDLEDFMNLPEALAIAWENGAFEMNPHWTPPSRDTEGELTEQGEESEPDDKSDSQTESSPGSDEKTMGTTEPTTSNGTSTDPKSPGESGD